VRHTNRLPAVLVPLVVTLALLTASREAAARVRLENICSVQGQREQKLMGLGLVVGLRGTGDGGDYLPTIRALGSALRLLHNPVETAEALKNSDNVALVLIEATIPATGIRRGQKIDCYVNSIGAAKSLRGGRLMMSPLKTGVVADERAVAIASGPVYIEDSSVLTSGKIPNGVVIEEDFEEFVSMFVENNSFTLLLDPAHSSFHAASEVARVVNADVSFEANGQQLAKPIGPGVVRVEIPEQYHSAPVDFIAQVLNVGIDNPHTEARVILNSKTGTIVVTGEVELSPVVVSHRNLTIAVGDQADLANAEPGNRFVPLMDQSRQAPQHLRELVDALNQLKVPTSDVIEIIKDLHRSGKLHAVLITE